MTKKSGSGGLGPWLCMLVSRTEEEHSLVKAGAESYLGCYSHLYMYISLNNLLG